MIPTFKNIPHKLIWCTGVIVCILTAVSMGVFMSARNPEQLLLGNWKEEAWEYEMIGGTKQHPDDYLSHELKNEICKNLIIHRTEVWNFSDNHVLNLLDSNRHRKRLRWNLKGRGHVLELRNDSVGNESYQVQELSDDRLVLHFGFDLQVRGIVKMTFKKIK